MVNAQPASPSPDSGLEEKPPESQRRPTSPSAPEAVFWHGLITGALRLVDATCDSSACVAVARSESSGTPRLSTLEQVLLCRAFQGIAQKNLAFEFRVSPATISQLLGTARAKLGLGERMGSTPLAVVLLALRQSGVTSLPVVRFGTFQREGHEYLELGWSLLDPAALTELSQGERHVARLVAWGASYKQIAEKRGTSTRTISNQIASVCAKLHVHGRFELIRKWVDRQWGSPAAVV